MPNCELHLLSMFQQGEKKEESRKQIDEEYSGCGKQYELWTQSDLSLCLGFTNMLILIFEQGTETVPASVLASVK